MSDAVAAIGTLLKRGNGATPEGFTTIAEVRDINGPGIRSNTVDVTNHSSVDGWKEYLATTLEASPVTFTINFQPTAATHSYTAGLILDCVNKTKRNFQIVFPNIGATTWAFTATVEEVSPTENVEDALTADVTLKLTGKPTLAG